MSNSVIFLCLYLLSFAFYWRGALSEISITANKGTSFIPGEAVKFTCSTPITSGEHKWSFNGAEVMDGGADGFFIVNSMSPDKRQTVLVFTYTVAKEGTYMCFESEQNASDAITTQDYNLTISGVFPTISGELLEISCDFESLNRQVIKYTWTVTNTDKTISKEIVTPNSTLTVMSVGADDIGEYQCKVTLNTTVELTTSSIDVTFLLPPALDGPALENKTVLIGEQSTFQLVCNITGNSGNISWTFQGNPISPSDSRYVIDETSTILSFAGAVGYSDEGKKYTCTGTNSAGSTTKTYQIIVLGPPEILTKDNMTFTANENDPLTLPCEFISNPPATLTLSRLPGSVISNIDDSRYSLDSEGFTIHALTVDDNAVFVCNISNEYGHRTIMYLVTVYGIPPIPYGLKAKHTQPESVVISWSSSDQYLFYIKPDNYTVEITSDGSDTRRIPSDSAEAPITGLVPGTEYKVRVSASNRAGSSQLSEYLNFSTNRSAPRFEYFNVTSLDGGRSLQLDWKLKFNGGSPVTNFTVTITSLGMEQITFELDVSESEQGSHLVTGLEPNIVYSVQTSIGNTVDTSLTNYSVTTARGPPSKPSKPVVGEPSIDSVEISFNVSSTGSESIDYYLVNISSAGSASQVRINADHPHVVSVMSDGTTVKSQSVVLLIDSLDGGSSYSFSVSAGGSLGSGPFSEYSDAIEIDVQLMLYYIIAGAVGGSLGVVGVIAAVCILLYCIKRRKKKRVSQKLTITDRLHKPIDFGFPNSSVSENIHMVEHYSPPSSAMEMRKEDVSPTLPHHGYLRVNSHQRNHSVSSTASSQMFRKDFLKSPTENQMLVPDSSDSAYGGSAEKVPAHIYHEIPPRSQSVGNNDRIWFSSPSINRVTYDVDSLPLKEPHISVV